MNSSQEMLTTFNDGADLLKKVITGGESWLGGWLWQSPIIPFFYDCGDKKKFETGAVGDTKKRVSEVYRGLEKMLA